MENLIKFRSNFDAVTEMLEMGCDKKTMGEVTPEVREKAKAEA
ncbi:hypothetical protein [Thermococcus sp. Bubb.Bath]|nr:hypothetical protein [Thermococcus sp. Bubb.Bath]